MRKNSIRNIVVHRTDSPRVHALPKKVSMFHAEVIERRLGQADLTPVQKISVIDKIMEQLRSGS